MAAVAFASLHFVQQSAWNRARLYRKLVSGQEHEQVAAASLLKDIRAEKELVRALQAESDLGRDLANKALQHLWFTAAGTEACQLNLTAYQAAGEGELDRALKMLNQLVARYPDYAEGWNQRASLFWRMNKYEQSLADCRRAIALNPDHFGAWQGLGACHFKCGNYEAASKAFRRACEILPHDAPTQRLLRECEELLHRSPDRSGRKEQAV